MSESISIKPMMVQLCARCFYAYRTGNQCAGCGSKDPPQKFWTDEDGDMLFQLVSDVRKQPLINEATS